MKKILFIQLPPALEQALTEQLRPFSALELASAAETTPDLIIARSAKETARFPGCPTLLLTGAKPHRLGAVLRQIGQMLAQPVLYIDDIDLGALTFKPQEKSLAPAEGEDIALTDREVDILAYLARHAGRPVNRDSLLRDVWQYQAGVDTHTLETHIYRLRQKIEVSADNPRLLLTVEGGYSLLLPERVI